MQPLCMFKTSDYILLIWPQFLNLKLKFVNYCEQIPGEAKKKNTLVKTTYMYRCQRFEIGQQTVFMSTRYVDFDNQQIIYFQQDMKQ